MHSDAIALVVSVIQPPLRQQPPQPQPPRLPRQNHPVPALVRLNRVVASTAMRGSRLCTGYVVVTAVVA